MDIKVSFIYCINIRIYILSCQLISNYIDIFSHNIYINICRSCDDRREKVRKIISINKIKIKLTHDYEI